MLKSLKSQSGAVPVFEVILLALVLTLGGYAGYQWYSAHNAVDHRAQPVAHRPSPSPNSTVGWKTYTSKSEGLSFMYPSNWKLVSHDTPEWNSSDAKVTGPNNIEVDWSSALDGLGGDCDPAKDPHLYFHALTPKTGLYPNFRAYVVEMGPKDYTNHVAIDQDAPDLGIDFKTGDTGACMHFTLFQNMAGTREMWLQGFASVNGKERALKPSEIETLRNIMLSAKY